MAPPQETSAIALPQTVKLKQKEKKKRRVIEQTNTNTNTQKWKQHKVLLAEDQLMWHILISATGMSQPDGQCNSVVDGFPWWKHWLQVASRTMWQTEYRPLPLSPDLPHKHTRSSGTNHPTACQPNRPLSPDLPHKHTQSLGASHPMAWPPNRPLSPDLPHKHTRSLGASHPTARQPNRTSQLTFCVKCLESGRHVFIAN